MPDVVSAAVVSAASGAVSGAVVSAVLQPLDVVRTRIQACAAASRPMTALEAARSIVTKGGLAGLWRGTAATVIRIGGGAAVSFYTLHFLRSWQRRDSGVAAHAATGAFCRSCAVTLMCPMSTEASHMGAVQYLSVREALVTIVRTEGPGALWRGLGPSLAANAPFSAIHYASYIKAQDLLAGGSIEGPWARNLAAGAVASVAATVATQPFDAVRTRAMLNLDSSLAGIRRAGLRGLLAGLLPRLLKRPLQTTLLWALYEDLFNKLRPRPA